MGGTDSRPTRPTALRPSQSLMSRDTLRYLFTHFQDLDTLNTSDQGHLRGMNLQTQVDQTLIGMGSGERR
jgi:hypothetical protein